MTKPAPRQSRTDREYILANLPSGTRRVQVINDQGAQQYKRPEDVDVDSDEIVIAKDGTPVVMRGKPGRKPKSPTLQPVTSQIAEVVEAREEHLETNDVILKVRQSADSEDTLDAVLQGLALEAASIEFDRIEAQRHGKETSNISTKRARVLKAMADVIIKRKQTSEGGVIDLESATFETLFGYMLETFKGAMAKGGCRAEQIEQTFTHLVSTLQEDNWKEEARSRMKDKTK